MPGEEPAPGSPSPGESSTPAFARLGLRTPAGWIPLPAEAPLPPPVIPDFDILRCIGGGAYGAVWLARNLTGSHFAIKVIYRRLFDHERPYERELAGIRRFEPISRSHPSQVAIHHVGQNPLEGYFYYVMDLADDATRPEANATQASEAQAALAPGARSCVPEHYVPKTLKYLLRTRGRLPFAECLDIALSLATALEHLHGNGLVHRDIKPSNVIFIEGVPKLADIGLVTSMDATQSFVGTEGFFPPEGPGTTQADIFSLGKLLYEIATGKDRREFPELPTDVMSLEEQEGLSELNAIILKCCQHDPQQRYATGVELRTELARLQHGRSIKRRQQRQRRWSGLRRFALPIGGGVLALIALVVVLQHQPGSGSVAANGQVQAQSLTNGIHLAVSAGLDSHGIFVLPLRPAATNGAPVDLCSRITDAFIDSLGLLTNQGITVGPRKSGWANLPEAGLFAQVTNPPFRMRYALTGQASTNAEELELTLVLHDLETTQPRWSATFQGATNQLVGLEQQALAQVFDALGVEPTSDQTQPLAELLKNNLEALGWLRRANLVYTQKGGTQSGYQEVRELAQRAMDFDPRYLDADLMDAYMLRSMAQDLAPSSVWRDVQVRMQRILQADDTVAGALDHLGGYVLFHDYDWEGSFAIWNRRVSYDNPQSRPWVRAFYYRFLGWFDEARVQQHASEESEPLGTDQRFLLASARWVEKRYAEGAQVARRTLELYPGHAEGYFWLAHCLVANGDYEEGIEATHKAQAVWKKQEMTALRAYAYAKMGQPEKAREVIEELKLQQANAYLQPYFVARVHAALGEPEQALDWLELAEREKSEYFYMVDDGGLRTDPAWDGLQNEPRYWQLCDRLGLGKEQWPRKHPTPKHDPGPVD